jgi:hypothetical protein
MQGNSPISEPRARLASRADFVEHLLITIYREYEKCLKAAIDSRIDRLIQVRHKRLAAAGTKKLYRGLQLNNFNGFLKSYDDSLQVSFAAFQAADLPAATAFASIVVNRHAIAHTQPSAVTFADLESFYLSSKRLVDEFERIAGGP